MMIKDGGPAFPTEHLETGYEVQPYVPHPGMTLRDWFAGMALTGIMATAPERAQFQSKEVARLAYVLADAMLEEKQRREKEVNHEAAD